MELERKEGKALSGARAMARYWLSILTTHNSFTLDNHTVHQDYYSVSPMGIMRFREVTGQGQSASKWHSRD